LEFTFEQEEGEAGLGGYRIITAATVLLWAVAAVLIPLGTDITFGLSGAVGGTMVVVGSISFTASIWATTVNRQHALASVLTSVNGLVMLLISPQSRRR
jgi:hypothetical protein